MKWHSNLVMHLTFQKRKIQLLHKKIYLMVEQKLLLKIHKADQIHHLLKLWMQTLTLNSNGSRCRLELISKDNHFHH